MSETTDIPETAPPPPSPPEAPKTRVWVRVLLALSLSLNLLVLGLVAGAHLRDGADRRATGPAPERTALRNLGFDPIVRALPREHRREIGRALRDRAGSLAESRQALAADLRRMLELIRAEPYDPAALRQVLEDQQTRIADRTRIGRNVVLERIAAMSAADRAAFADRLEQSLRRAIEDARR